MPGDDPTPPDVNAYAQADTLLDVHDHVSRVIANIDLPFDELASTFDIRYKPGDETDTFSFESIVRVFLYKEIGGFSQQETCDRLEKKPYLQVRFGLPRAPRRSLISHVKRKRFSRPFRGFIGDVADDIRRAAQDNDLRSDAVATLDGNAEPDEVAASSQPLYKYVDEHAPKLIQNILQQVGTSFDTGRAENTVHDDKRVWEHQTAMSLMDRSGTRAAFRSFNKQRSRALHHDTHTYAVKKLGTPDGYQYSLPDFVEGRTPIPDWRAIADTVQNQFNDAIDNVLETLVPGETFTQPVVASIDVTGDPFHVTGWKSEEDAEPGEERLETGYGSLRVPKDDYPEMVNGGEERGVYEYQYATLTIVGQNAPIVLAVEPVRHNSNWEGEDGESVSWAEVVDRLMMQAAKHVDIHLVMADRAFDSYAVEHVLDQYYDTNYLIPKKKHSDFTKAQAERVEKDEDLNCIVEHGKSVHLSKETPYIDTESDSTVDDDGFSHDTTLMFVPAEKEDWVAMKRDDVEYAVFVTNRQGVNPDDALGFSNRYSKRWDIEMEYKMIKPLLPSIASTDYRMRFFAFMFSCLLYNMWRLVDHNMKVLTAAAFDEYGRGPHEDRLDTLLPFADFLMTVIHEIFNGGLDPPDCT